MAEALAINKEISDSEIYRELIPQIESLLNPDEPLISNLSNVTAALKESFDKISWVGFYLLKGNQLYLGPFQGKIACTVIQLGSGVCGTAANKKETIIVEDVEKFPGHIACDSGSRSEIVIPLISNKEVIAVLDLDSYHLSSFNADDKIFLEQLCTTILNKLDFSQLNQILY